MRVGTYSCVCGVAHLGSHGRLLCVIDVHVGGEFVCTH